MGKKQPKYPKPDRRIGEAAIMSAEAGAEYLEWMRGQAEITNAWAAQDRERHQSTFLPLQDAYIEEMQEGPDYGGVEADVRDARADARLALSQAQAQQQRQMAAMGVDPRSGRSSEATRRGELDEALAVTGAGNATRMQSKAAAEAEHEMMRANALNMGSGLGVNPATSMGLSNGAGSSGFSGMMQGQGQAMRGFGMMHDQAVGRYNAQVNHQNSTWGGIGSIVGLGLSMMPSSKEIKEDKRPARGVLEALREMPVEEWKYKDGVADGGHHVGPYAEDFQKATGKGDGKSIPVVDAIGVTMGAVQELDRKIDKLAKAAGAKGEGGGKSGAGPSPKSIMGAL